MELKENKRTLENDDFGDLDLLDTSPIKDNALENILYCFTLIKSGLGAWSIYGNVNGKSIKKDGIVESSTTPGLESIVLLQGLTILSRLNFKTCKITLHSNYCYNTYHSYMQNWSKNNWKTTNKKTPANVEEWKRIYQLKKYFEDMTIQIIFENSNSNPFQDECFNLANLAITKFKLTPRVQKKLKSGEKLINTLYCDGSCLKEKNNAGGWCLYGFLDGKEIEKTGSLLQTTSNVMELTAFINCLELIKQSNGTQFKIFSDSKYVGDGFTSWMDTWKSKNWKKADGSAPKNLELWIQVDELKSELIFLEKKVDCIWIKAHDKHNSDFNTLYNIRVDEKAQLAANDIYYKSQLVLEKDPLISRIDFKIFEDV